MKMSTTSVAMVKRHMQKDGCCNKNKQTTNTNFCNYCVLCIAFIVPVTPGIQRNFESGGADYPDMVQSKLTDFSSSQWRPPNA